MLIKHLSAHDKKKAQNLTTTRRQQTFIIGRALLAAALQQLTGSRYYLLSYTTLGKPQLILPQPWQFNVSHSGQHIVIALQTHNPLGIDCEFIRPRNYSRIIENIFSAKEQQAIQAAPDNLTYFYQLWTQREARIKYEGNSVFSAPTNIPQLDIRSFHYKDCLFSLCRPPHTHKPIRAYHYHFADKNIEPITLTAKVV